MFALADCNNFFVSCERVFNPALENKPVIVLSSNDGCVIARSNEVKALGIKMGTPLFQIQALVKKYDIQIFSSNYILYGDMSARVHDTLRQMLPSIEVYSIDEAFLDLRELQNEDLGELARKISKTCQRNTGIPVSVGVAATKTLAKIASKLCKSYPKLEGGCYMHKPQDIEKILRKTPINDIWGIGHRYARKLELYSIKTAWDFSQFDSKWIHSELGINGLKTQRELQGIPSLDFTEESSARQQICISRSFASEISNLEELSEQLSTFCSMACEKLRKQKSLCLRATIFAYTNRFKLNEAQQYEAHEIKFPVATNSTLEINSYAQEELKKIFISSYKYKKAGIILSNLISEEKIQLNLFDKIDRTRHQALMETLDRINSLNNRKIIQLASTSSNGLKISREHLSPEYTTKWEDIISVKS